MRSAPPISSAGRTPVMICHKPFSIMAADVEHPLDALVDQFADAELDAGRLAGRLDAEPPEAYVVAEGVLLDADGRLRLNRLDGPVALDRDGELLIEVGLHDQRDVFEALDRRAVHRDRSGRPA